MADHIITTDWNLDNVTLGDKFVAEEGGDSIRGTTALYNGTGLITSSGRVKIQKLDPLTNEIQTMHLNPEEIIALAGMVNSQ